MSSADDRGPARRRRRKIVVGLVLSLLLVGTVAVRGGWQARSAASDLLAAGDLLRQLELKMRTGETQPAERVLALLQQKTHAAKAETDGLLWRVGGHLPWLGPNVSALREVAAVLDELTQRGLPELVGLSGSLNAEALAPQDGRIDVTRLQQFEPGLIRADDAFRSARDRLNAVTADGLVTPLRNAVNQLTRSLTHAAAVTATAARLAVLLPPMLGSAGKRTYLVLFQNNAEVRATGGMPGAFIVVSADRGQVRIVDEGNASYNLKGWTGPVLRLDPAARSLYTDRPAVFAADVNLGPDFPTAAVLARRMYQLSSGHTVDGVLATDPIAMSYLLRAIGPVTVPEGVRLTATNAVSVLLSQAYATMSIDDRKEHFLTGAARAVFGALTAHPANPSSIVAQLAQAAGERRLLVWSAHPEEQSRLIGTVLGGVLPVDEGVAPTVGVFLDDGSGAKLDYYLSQSAVLRLGMCRADGRRELRLSVRLSSSVPTSGLPSYVLGLGMSGDLYTARTNVLVFSPIGGAVVDAQLDGVALSIGSGAERGRSVGLTTVDLKPGQARTLDVTMLTAAYPVARLAEIAPRLWTTPMVSPWRTEIASGTPCG